ncbi:hypothetical protein ACLOJK_027103 [Asimina triloba]
MDRRITLAFDACLDVTLGQRSAIHCHKICYSGSKAEAAITVRLGGAVRCCKWMLQMESWPFVLLLCYLLPFACLGFGILGRAARRMGSAALDRRPTAEDGDALLVRSAGWVGFQTPYCSRLWLLIASNCRPMDG